MPQRPRVQKRIERKAEQGARECDFADLALRGTSCSTARQRARRKPGDHQRVGFRFRDHGSVAAERTSLTNQWLTEAHFCAGKAPDRRADEQRSIDGRHAAALDGRRQDGVHSLVGGNIKDEAIGV